MDRTNRLVEWDGTTMRPGLDAGRLEVVYREGEPAEALGESGLKRRVERGEEGVRLIDHRRVASVTLQRVPAVPSIDDGPGLWSPSLVEARLRRAYDIFRAMPGAADIWPAGHKSCMPQPILDRLVDYAPETVRRARPTREEIDLAQVTYERVLDLVLDPADMTRLVLLEAVGLGRPWKKVARNLRRRPDAQTLSNHAAKARARKIVVEVAEAWTSKGYAFDDLDIRLARALHDAGQSVIH